MNINTKSVKLKNRRVSVGRVDDGIYVGFTRLKCEGETIIPDQTITGKKVETKLVLTKAMAVALFYLLREELTIGDVAEFERESGQSQKLV